MMLSPLAADMHDNVFQMAEEHYLLFGPGGAFATAFGLFNTALALGTMFGPAFAGLLYDREGWQVAMWAIAAFCASGAVPVVRSISSPVLHNCGLKENILTRSTGLDAFHWKDKGLLNKI